MRYDAYEKESRHIRSQSDALRESGERTYLLRTGSKDYGAPFADRELQLRVSVIPNDTVPSIYMGINVHGSGTLNEMGYLKPEDFRRLAQAREIVDEWIDGKRMSLPDHMPWEQL